LPENGLPPSLATGGLFAMALAQGVLDAPIPLKRRRRLILFTGYKPSCAGTAGELDYRRSAFVLVKKLSLSSNNSTLLVVLKFVSLALP
jgi:hypothetical protein